MTPQPPEVAALLARSNRLGSDPRNTNYAGGNASVKAEADDPVTGQPVPLLWVKGSGGDLGTLKRGELAQDVETQILALQPGEISKPYRSQLGYHVFRLESKEGLEGEALVRAQAQIREILFREKYEARLDAWLKELKQRAIIEVRL